MIIVDQGKVVELCAEPGEFTWNASSEPSLFAGDLGDAIVASFAQIGKHFTFGGDAGKDQRVYYFNTKEIVGNKYGTPSPVPFRVVDNNIGLDVDISVRCNGEYSYRIVNPMLFYTNVCGNIADDFKRSEIDSQLKTELLTALQPAFAKISAMGIRYSAIPAHTIELSEALNDVLSEKWQNMRGIVVASFGVNSITASKEDEDMIKALQKSAVMRDPTMAAATLVGAQADAMRAAASNENGAMTGFMGMGMAQQAGGMNTQGLFAMGQSAKAKEGAWKCECGAENDGKFCSECGKAKPEPKAAAGTWKCSCGAVNTGKFCSECGAKAPASGKWKCECGAENDGKFCSECGSKRPE
jgi:membrane protease subunit (stomatin/prohibitin family)